MMDSLGIFSGRVAGNKKEETTSLNPKSKDFYQWMYSPEACSNIRYGYMTNNPFGIHVWYIHLHLVYFQANIPYMDCMVSEPSTSTAARTELRIIRKQAI